MRNMSGRVIPDAAKRRALSLASATLIAVLLIYTALPLCSAAFTCSMPCCAATSEPMEHDDAMPLIRARLVPFNRAALTLQQDLGTRWLTTSRCRRSEEKR